MSNALARAELETHAPGIRQVPEEILRAIFTIVFETLNILWDAKLDYMYDHRSPAHGSLTLSHVCAAWRTTARNYGQLWRAVDLAEPELAELCLDLSKRHNLHVFCRTVQKMHNEPEEPKPRYIAALERVFKESARIETLRLSDSLVGSIHRPYYLQGILPIVTRLDAEFTNLKTLRGMEWERGDLSPLVRGASASLRKLELPSCVLSLDAFFSLHSVVKLRIDCYMNFQLDDWRRLFGQLAPTLRHLVVLIDGMGHMNPPVTLPVLETLHLRGSGHEACASLHAPQATHITIEDGDRFEEDEQELVGDHYSVAINQRFPDISSLHHPFHLRYLHGQNITVSNGDMEFAFEVTCSIRMLAFLCFGLHPALRHTVTHLEIWSVSTADPVTGEEDALNHSQNYREISEYLSGLEEIYIDADTAADLLLWHTRAENRTAFSTVNSIKLSYFGHNTDTSDQNSMVQILVEVQNMRVESGHPIQLTFVSPGEVSQGTLDLLRKEGHVVLVDDDVDVCLSALV
jgi:hypothetical protein